MNEGFDEGTADQEEGPEIVGRNNKINMTIINANARSLTPKIDSLLDCMEEYGPCVAVVTETWMRDSELEMNLSDLSLGAGVGILSKNRDPLTSNGVSYGGVAILWNENLGSFKKLDIGGGGQYEVIVGVGSLKNLSRRLVVVSCYLPPGMDREKGKACLE